MACVVLLGATYQYIVSIDVVGTIDTFNRMQLHTSVFNYTQTQKMNEQT